MSWKSRHSFSFLQMWFKKHPQDKNSLYFHMSEYTNIYFPQKNIKMYVCIELFWKSFFTPILLISGSIKCLFTRGDRTDVEPTFLESLNSLSLSFLLFKHQIILSSSSLVEIPYEDMIMDSSVLFAILCRSLLPFSDIMSSSMDPSFTHSVVEKI